MKNLQSRLASLQAQLEKQTKAENKAIQEDSRYDITENSVVKSNALARSYYRFDIVEKRIMEAMIGKLDSRLADKEQCQFIELSAAEYAKAYGIPSPKSYQEMAKAVDRLMANVMTIRGEKSKKKYALMIYAEYFKGEGKIVASFSPLIAKHLVALREHFISYKLKKAVNFKSSYSWRLFEIMMSWKKTDDPVAGWFTVSIGELKEMLGASEKYNYKDLRVRGIDPAIQEIDRELNIKVWYEPIKCGRRVEMLRFNFIEDEQQKLDLK